MDQVKEFILASGSFPDQGIIDSLSSLYNPPHCGTSTLTLGPYIASDHLITTIIDIAPSGAESSIHIDSCLDTLLTTSGSEQYTDPPQSLSEDYVQGLSRISREI